jgi:hypothetical protein
MLALGLMGVTADNNSSAALCTAAPEEFCGWPPNCGWTFDCGRRSLRVIEPPSQSDRASNPLHHRTLLSVPPLSHRSMSGVRRLRHV